MFFNLPFSHVRLLGLASFAMLTSASGSFAQSVNVYTYREPDLIRPLFDAFTKESGVKVNVIFAKEGLEQRIASEGASSPADVLLTVDIGRLQQAVELGVTQPIQSRVLEANIPAQYRDPAGQWFGLSARARVIYASRDRVKDQAITYEDLADPKWKGKICIRSGQNIYNVGLIAGAVARMGEEKAAEWLSGVKANLAKKPSGGDREVARDIAAGQCDIGIGNTYYVALMLNREADRKGWADAVRVVMPSFRNGGTHVNISGVVVAKHAPNKAEAVKLIEWLSQDQAQKLYAEMNFEYPVKPGIDVEKGTVATWGALRPDPAPLAEVARNRKTASQIVDKVGFDN
jgi:iron(III) transport system substrate-binding protein